MVPRGGPDGGDGGKGGDVIFEADARLRSLLDLRFQREYRAQNGDKGGTQNKAGKDGATMGQKERTKAVSCMMKGMPSPVWDGIGHAHQRYVFQLLTTYGPSSTP